MSSTPYNNNRGAQGNGGGRGRKRNRGKSGNPLHRFVPEHSGQASGEAVGPHQVHAQYGGAPNTPQPSQKAFSPSVQKLFDSVDSPVNLQITVTGQSRHVSESGYVPAEPVPTCNPVAKQHHLMEAAQRSQQGGRQVQGDGGHMEDDKEIVTEEAWPTLGDSLGTSPKKSGADSSNQKFKRVKKRTKKGKQKNGLNVPPDGAVNSVDPATDQLITKMVNVAVSEPVTSTSTAGNFTQPAQTGARVSDTQVDENAGRTKETQAKKASKKIPKDQAPPAGGKMASKQAATANEELQAAKDIKHSQVAVSADVGAASADVGAASADVAAASADAGAASADVGAASADVGATKIQEVQTKMPTTITEKTTPKPVPSSTKDTNTQNGSSPASQPAASGSEVAESATRKKTKAEPRVNVHTQFLEEYRSKVGNKYIQALDEDFIRPLAKKSSKFPWAFFYCRLCEFHMETDEAMEEHRTSEEGHLRRKRIKTGDELLRSMPQQTTAHMHALTAYLDQVYADVVLPEQEAAGRKATVDQLEKDLHELSDTLKCVRLQVCGSIRAGFALKGSNTNIRIISPKTANPAELMTGILSIVSSLECKYKTVEHHFGAREPYISFTVDGMSGTFQLQFIEESYYISNMLYSCYSKWHPKLQQLCVLFKYMAKISRLSDNSSGALAPYCFPLMAIFYCQRNSMAPIFFQTVDLETVTEAEFQADVDNLDLTQQIQCRQNVELRTIGELWLKLLRFYSLDFKQEIYVVSVMNRQLVQKAEKAWGSKRLAIEDPALPKRNLCKTVSHQRVFDFISDVIRKAYNYFGIPQLQSGPAFTKIYLENESAVSQKVGSPAAANYVEGKESAKNSQSTEHGTGDSVPTATDAEADNQSENDQKKSSATETENGVADVKTASSAADDDLYDREMVEKLSAHDIQFDFKSKRLSVNDLQLPIFCRMCSKPNHTSDNCPEEQLPPCVPLPPPSAHHRSVLSRLLVDIREQTQLMPDEIQTRELLVQELVYRISTHFPDVQLTLYGSSCNGFGSTGSDLDICMTLKGVNELTIEETRAVIKKVGSLLRAVSHLKDVVALTTAKVPIVKCYSEKYNLEADVSLYNILAQRNTKMLHRYSQVDERVRTLGYCVKEFAKNCDIGDASRGSLSSYAYVIMLIYYLQQCDPPVLPVLQELYTEDKMPEVMVEGWNTWYYSGDNVQLAKVWPGYRKNTHDVAQLWLGFLDFYSQKFQYKSHVVSIRKKKLMTKFEKLWNSDTLAIEDPFDLKRNLGAALSKKMNAYILTTLIKARSVFHTPSEERDELPEEKKKSVYSFYFKHEDIVSADGAPSINRACNFCGQVGHYIKACPKKAQKADRGRQLREMRKQAKEEAEMRNRVQKLSAGEYQQMPIADQHRPMSAHHRQRASPSKQSKSAGSRRVGPPNMPYRTQVNVLPPSAYNAPMATPSAMLRGAGMVMQPAAYPIQGNQQLHQPAANYLGAQSMIIVNSSLQANRHNPLPQHKQHLPQ